MLQLHCISSSHHIERKIGKASVKHIWIHRYKSLFMQPNMIFNVHSSQAQYQLSYWHWQSTWSWLCQKTWYCCAGKVSRSSGQKDTPECLEQAETWDFHISWQEQSQHYSDPTSHHHQSSKYTLHFHSIWNVIQLYVNSVIQLGLMGSIHHSDSCINKHE